jgi:CelD/BcsL family acetyltransferase involved in cellulose biosynthesis
VGRAEGVIRLIGSLEEMQAAEGAWRKLETNAPGATIFQSYDFCRCWWSCFGAGKLHILTLWNQEELSGIGPLYRSRAPLGRLRFLGSGIADYLGFLAAPGLSEAVSQQFLTIIRESLGFRIAAADLTQMPHPPSNLGGCESFVCEVCPRLKLPETYEELLSRLGKKTRFNLGYYRRRLEREGVLQVRRSSSESLEQDLATLFRLHRLRWKSRGLPGVLRSGRVQRFHQEFTRLALEANRASLFLLEHNQEPLAAMLCYDFGLTRTYYIGGFNPAKAEHSPGKVLIAEAIRDAIERGMTVFDFARGDEGYKRLFRPEITENYRVFIGVSPWAAPQRLRLAWERSLISVGRKALKWRFEKGTA